MSANAMPQRDCNEVEDALGAYALGIVDGDELDTVDRHLERCPACAAALAEHQRTVGALALATRPMAPAAAGRDRLLAVAGRPQAAPAPTPIAGGRSGRLHHWALPALAIAATLLLVGIGVLGVLLTRVIDQRNDAESTAQLLSTYVSSGGQVLNLETQPVSLYQPYNGKGSLLTAPGRDPVVVVAGCPKSGDFLTYWVWFEKGGQRVGAGKLTVGEDGSGWIALAHGISLNDFDTIGVTLQLDDNQREDVFMAPLPHTALS